MPPSRGVGRFVRPCIGPAGMAAPTPSGPPHRLTFRAGSIERTARSMSRIGSTGEPTRHVCRYGCRQQRQPRPVGSLYVRCRVRRRRPLPTSAAARAVRLLPAANAFRPAHRLPLMTSLQLKWALLPPQDSSRRSVWAEEPCAIKMDKVGRVLCGPYLRFPRDFHQVAPHLLTGWECGYVYKPSFCTAK